jgi:glutamate carboxypeptidase
MQKLLQKIDDLSGEYIALWEKICNIESPTEYKAGIDRAGECLLEIARQKGWDIRLCPQENAGDAFSITLNPDADGAPVVFSGHMDTVHPVGFFGTPAVRMDDEKIYGPGVRDCKGGVVASMLALDALWQCGFQKRPVKLVVQTDEETSSANSNLKTIDFMIEESKNAVAFLNTEGILGNSAVLIRKGILRYRFTVHGKAMHGSKCADGASAICEAAHKIIELEKMKDPKGLTCNCGVIEGGTAVNSVPDFCTFAVDIRFANEEQCRIAAELCQKIAQESTIKGCTCELQKLSVRPSMDPSEKNDALFKTMNDIYAACGLPVLTAKATLGGSDAAYTTRAGIPTVDNLGVDGDEIHSIREFAYLRSLAASAKRLAAVAYKI